MDEIIDLLDSASKRYPIKALCDELNKAESTLRNELTQQEGYKLGLRTSIQIMKKTGDLTALDRIEGLFNRVAFSLPEPEPKNMATVMELVSSISKEFGEYVQEHAKVILDGKVDPDEAVRVGKELTDLLEAVLQARAYFKTLEKKKG